MINEGILENGSYYFIACPDCNANIIIFCHDGSICMALCGKCNKVNAICDDGFDVDGYDTSIWGSIGTN